MFQMTALQNQGDDASATTQDPLPSLYDEDVRHRLLQYFDFHNKDGQNEQDLEKATFVCIKEAHNPSEINLLQALPNLERVELASGFSSEGLALALQHIKKLEISDCDSLTSVPPVIGQLIQLQSLVLRNCWSLTSMPSEIGQLIQLQTLNIWNCPYLTSVPPEIVQLFQLQTLGIGGCDSLTTVPPVINLQTLDIDWDTLTSASSVFVQLTNLEKLEIDSLDCSTPISPIFLQALSPQCSILVYGKVMFDKLHHACEMSCSEEECKVSDGWTYSFKRNDMDPYFDKLRHYPIGTIKFQMLTNKALQRAVTRVYLPEGAKYKDLERRWNDML